jgi:hypothetical protein
MQHTMDEVEVPRRRAGDAISASRRRLVYFCLAALWGYLLGIGVLAAAMSRIDVRVPLEGGVLAWLLTGALLGLAGGLIVAGAYKEARRRHR